MITSKVILFVFLIVVIVIELFRNINRWSSALQKNLVDRSKKSFGNGMSWEKPWRLVLLKVILVFFGVVLIAMVYSFFFGVIYL